MNGIVMISLTYSYEMDSHRERLGLGLGSCFSLLFNTILLVPIGRKNVSTLL